MHGSQAAHAGQLQDPRAAGRAANEQQQDLQGPDGGAWQGAQQGLQAQDAAGQPQLVLRVLPEGELEAGCSDGKPWEKLRRTSSTRA